MIDNKALSSIRFLTSQELFSTFLLFFHSYYYLLLLRRPSIVSLSFSIQGSDSNEFQLMNYSSRHRGATAFSYPTFLFCSMSFHFVSHPKGFVFTFKDMDTNNHYLSNYFSLLESQQLSLLLSTLPLFQSTSQMIESSAIS